MEVEFEIEVNNLLDFLQKIKSDEYNLLMDNVGWSVSTTEHTQVLYQNVLLDRGAFVKYPELEKEVEVSIDKHQKFLRFVKRFKGKVHLLVGEKYLVISSPGSEAHMMLAAKGVIPQGERPKKVKFDTFLKLKVGVFQDAIGDADLLETDIFHLQTKNGKFSITTKSNIDKCIREQAGEYPDASAKYGEYIKDIFGTLVGEVSIAFKTDEPIMIKHDSKYCKTTYILAPFVPPEEEVKK